jgi:type I restriction enzyme S subunit
MLEIIDRVDSAMENISSVQAVTISEAARSAALRQSILKDAFAGKLVPQDPADEPAAELLARIRANCAAERKKPSRRRASA